jgi:hypothetical protein
MCGGQRRRNQPGEEEERGDSDRAQSELNHFSFFSEQRGTFRKPRVVMLMTLFM